MTTLAPSATWAPSQPSAPGYYQAVEHEFIIDADPVTIVELATDGRVHSGGGIAYVALWGPPVALDVAGAVAARDAWLEIGGDSAGS